jgi:hypothetical protein
MKSNSGTTKVCVAFVAITVALLTSGCGSVRIYSDTRDKQGAAAKEAWAKVDFKALVATERANLKKLLDAEMETQDQLAIAIRDYELKGMVGNATLSDGLLVPVGVRIDEIAGSVDQLSNATKILRTREVASIVMTTAAIPFTTQTLKAPTCAQLRNGATPKAVSDRMTALEADSSGAAKLASLTIGLEELRKQCAIVSTQAEDQAYGLLGGEAAVAWARYKRDRDEVAAQKKRAQELQQVYEQAQAAYDAALKNATADPNLAKDVKEAAGKLLAIVNALETENPFTAKFITKERLDSLDAFLRAIAETPPGGGPPKDASRALIAFITVPDLYDSSVKALAEAKRPLAVPLLLRRTYEQLNHETANRQAAASEAIVQASKEIVDALYQQAVELDLARMELARAGITAQGTKKLQAAFDSAAGDDRTALYSGAARYLDALNRLDAKRYKLEYRRVALIHERSLAYAEVNLKQWDELIGVTVDQMATFGASGIKSEAITNLLNTIGIFYIGVGVNK